MQELQGQCRASYGSAFLGQKGTVGQGCCGTWGSAWAWQEGGAGLWGQESLQMWKQSQSLGSCRVWNFYSRKGGMSSVLVWNTIFPIIRDFWNTTARQCVSSGMLQGSRGTRAHIVIISSRVLGQSCVHPLSPLHGRKTSWPSPLWSVCFKPGLNPTLPTCRDSLEMVLFSWNAGFSLFSEWF